MRFRCLLAAVLFIICAMIGIASHPLLAAEYFFDSQMGSDENSGTNPDKSLRTLEKLAALKLDPGDVVRFKRGCEFRGVLSFRGNGIADNPIRLTAYGDGPKPEFLGSIRLTEWEKHEGEVYMKVVPVEEFVGKKMVYSIYEYAEGKVPVRLLRDNAIPTERGRFFFNEDTFTVYLITSDGSPPSEHRIEVSVIENLVSLTDRRWIEMDNLAFLFGNCRHIVISNSSDITIKNCASLFVGFYGNPNILIVRDSTRISLVDCFLYENANCGVFISSGSNRCLVSGCTIVKCRSNDGVTLHSGGLDENGVRQGITGDYNVVENNVIGLCPEESIDITSGDYHIIRGNICYGNRNPGIIVGHDADHILIQNNISFNNARAGIQISGSKQEGARGHNQVIQNLVYNNGYPGLEIQSENAKVFNNTVIDSINRVAVRINPQSEGLEFRNNLIATLDSNIGHRSLHFIGCTPTSLGVNLSHNLFFHRADQIKPETFFPAGQLIRTDDGSFSLTEFTAKYGTGEDSFIAEPEFASGKNGYYFLTSDSPGVDAGTDVGLPFAGSAPDIGWKELGAENTAPKYPPVLIDGGDDDDEEILYLWGKIAKRHE